MSVGSELAAARERLGLSRADVSNRTKISVERLLAIEQHDVANLPPLVYVKGFVREYATAVKLDPDDVTRRYVASVEEIDSIAQEPPVVESDRGPVAVPVSEGGTDLFHSEDDEVPARIAHQAAPRIASDLPPPVVDEVRPSRVTARDDFGEHRMLLHEVPPSIADIELSQHRHAMAPAPQFGSVQRPPRTGMRGGLLAVVLAVVAGILVAAYGERLGLMNPRRVTSPADAATRTPSPIRPDATPASRASESATVESPARATNDRPAGRVPGSQESDTPAPTAAPTTAAPTTAAPTTAAPTTAAAPPAGTPSPASADRSVSGSTRPPAAPPVAALDAPPRTEPPSGSSAPVASPTSTHDMGRRSNSDLTGSWSWTTRVEITDVEAFENMNLGFRLQLQQTGDRIKGRGLKWMENGRLIPSGSRTPIIVDGERRGDRVELRFTEHGALRRSSGTFVMDVGADGTLHGQFASTSANSSGTAIAQRLTTRER